MNSFFKEKEIEIKDRLEKEFKGKEWRLENSGNGTFVAHVIDMYFFGGQWRRLYVNRVFIIQKEVGPLTISVDKNANEYAITRSIEAIHHQLDVLLQDLGYE
ncbi:hypothetical protein [Psychrobacter sp.]|uniref:hypothetical protein n=1 Tax=Psychrobacter sp. TaxID=56811 RepID=UPI003F9CF7E4